MNKEILKFRKEEAGFTLLELLLVVGVGSILLLAGIGTYRLVTAGNNVNEANRLLATIKQQVQNLYQGQTSYGNNTDIESVLISAGSFPASALNADRSSARTPWNENIDVRGATANFTIAFDALPADACINLVRLDIANDPDFVSVEVNGSAPSGYPVSPVDAQGLCGTASNNVVWTFF